MVKIMIVAVILLSYAAVASTMSSQDPCEARSDDVPCLRIPSCEAAAATGGGTFGDFKVSDAKGDVPARQSTSGSVCYDTDGLHVQETAQEEHIFSPYTQCNDEVFASSDVLEVFLAPVLEATDNPIW